MREICKKESVKKMCNVFMVLSYRENSKRILEHPSGILLSLKAYSNMFV